MGIKYLYDPGNRRHFLPYLSYFCNMHIILAAATAAEIAPFCERMAANDPRCAAHDISILITGVGQAAAAWALTDALHRHPADLVIQAGIAGVFDHTAPLGQVVVASTDVFGDLGTEAKGVFTPITATALQYPNELPYVNGRLPNDWLGAFTTLPPVVDAVTVNRVTDDAAQCRVLTENFAPAIETMEGAALHYVCRRQNTPFIQYRATSNTVGERDKTRWMITEAIQHLNKALLALLPTLRGDMFALPRVKTAPPTLSLSFSPCPNDTFIFDALVHGKIDTQGLTFDVLLDDVETLNEHAIAGLPDITKLSYGVLPLVLDRYRVLNSGSALGRGVGPLLVTRAGNTAAVNTEGDFSVALPGEHTTAHLLFSAACPGVTKKSFLRYDMIEQAVLNGQTTAGVLIHENRFTYAEKGLEKVTDLGDFWEKTSGQPIPLGGIVIRRNLPATVQQTVDRLIKQSVQYAFAHYPQLSPYVRQHAQEMNEAVMRQHIDLYVNDFSIDLGKAGRTAVLQLLNSQGKQWTEKEVFDTPAKAAYEW